jgi:hypothetical protein
MLHCELSHQHIGKSICSTQFMELLKRSEQTNLSENILKTNISIEMMKIIVESIWLCFRYGIPGNNIVCSKRISQE